MRVIFMGTPDFAVPSLQALNATYDVVGVVTRPDAVRARGKKLEPSPVKVVAAAAGIPVFEAKRMTPELLSELAALEPDIICVAAYGAILPDSVIEMAPYGCINVHASLLPRWRGAAPIARAVLAGDREAGVSIMQVVSELDAGDYCLQGGVSADGKSAVELTDELGHLGARLLVQAIAQIEAGTVIWQTQDESQVTYAAKIAKVELCLDPSVSAHVNERRILAQSDAAPARVSCLGQTMRVLKARPTIDLGARPGHVRIERGRIALGCADGVLELLEVKPDGKRAMPARAWAQGIRDDVERTWQHI